MKINFLRALLGFYGLSVLAIQAAEPFNPAPARIESPRDDAQAVLKRLTTMPDGKTLIQKNLTADWIKTLADRGEPKLYTKANSQDFAYIGMPVGGIGAGELYLSGDGRLWDWDIFGLRNRLGFPVENGAAYQFPHKVLTPGDDFQTVVQSGFVIRTKAGDKSDTRALDQGGFSDVSFSGQYPIGSVDYSDAGSPVRIHLDAFSPFIPGNVADSSYPATILSYTVENTSKEKVEATIGGYLENAAAILSRDSAPVMLENNAFKEQGVTAIDYSVKEIPFEGPAPTMFDDFESGTYGNWKVEGEAFNSSPPKRDSIGHGNPLSGNQGSYYVDSYRNSNDNQTGKLTSKPFVLKQPYLSFLIGGGNKAGVECINLVVDGKTVQTATGQNDEILRPVSWDVKDLNGKTAQIEIVDQSAEGWGHILIDNIMFADTPGAQIKLKEQQDIGSMALAVLGDGEAAPEVNGDKLADDALDAKAAASAQKKVSGDKEKLVGAVRRTVTLEPGEKKTVSFIMAWYFPNPLLLGLSTSNTRQYVARFKSAQDVVDHIAGDFNRLSSTTHLWHDTWYDSTLPYYFLDRTFLNVSTLACSTDYLLSDGRFYGYEGRYSCPGTCTHVYSYQQAMGYLFPDLEKGLMEKDEFVPGLGMNDKGGVAMRSEYDKNPPVDGQSGIVLRAYLTHRMSTDDSFLKRNYASIKKATDYLVNTYDTAHAGILVGAQGNTMDAAWYGNNTWMSLYYEAALRAMAEMADASNDSDYAKSLRAIADKGRSYIETQLFNGEYFIHQADPAHPESPGTFAGCTLEELMGQNWAYQVGLGNIIDHDKALTALNSIWKYDYTTNVGPYRDVFQKGRWYAMPGEGGLIMCTFPHGGEDTLKKGADWASAYDNECWPGSEYEITATMMWVGQVDRALAEIKTLQERFDGSKRNPWDECECGSHYSRSMASYGVFTAACGFEYDGPRGTMAFAPRVNPENFKAAFTSAEGWGGFSQKYSGHGLDASVNLRCGMLRLKTFSLVLPPGNTGKTARAQVDGKEVPLSSALTGDRIAVTFTSDLLLKSGQELNISIN
jgi:non-lysosomal glucosylceramidase